MLCWASAPTLISEPWPGHLKDKPTHAETYRAKVGKRMDGTTAKGYSGCAIRKRHRGAPRKEGDWELERKTRDYECEDVKILPGKKESVLEMHPYSEKRWRMNNGLNQSWDAPPFYVLLWNVVEAIWIAYLASTNNCGDEPMNKTMISSSQATLVPIG